jgi:hypothetical protein
VGFFICYKLINPILDDMNVNWDKKCILMCQTKTGDKDVCEYFGKIGFVSHFFLDKFDDKPLTRKSFSNKFLFPWIYDDFKLIVTMDNPYRRIVNEYKRFSHINWGLKTNVKEDLYNRFNTKFDELFMDDLYKVELDNRIHESQYNFLLPYDLSVKIPDYIINVENLINDIHNIDVLDHTDHDFSLIDQIDLSDKYKDVFSYQNARVIYKVHRHIFDMMGYDPFSFTTQDLTQKERVHFIHY